MDLVEGLFPAGKVHLLGGAAGAGKTTFLAWMLREIRAERPIFGKPTHAPTGIYYIAADQDWDSYQEIIDAVGLKLDGFYSFADDPAMSYKKFSTPDPVPLLKRALDEAIDARPGSVVVVDIFGVFLGNDLRRYREIMAYMWEYGRWVKQKRITLIGSVHAGKQKAGEAERYVRLFDRVMGGGPMRGSCSTACYLTSAEEAGNKGYQLFEMIPRRSEPVTIQVAWDKKTGLLLPISEPYTEELSESALQILDLIPHDGGVSAGNIVDAAATLNLSRATVFRGMSKLKNAGLIAKRGGANTEELWIRLRGN